MQVFSSFSLFCTNAYFYNVISYCKLPIWILKNTTYLSWVFTQISKGGFLWNQTNNWHSPYDYFLQHVIYRLLKDRIFWICSKNTILRCHHLNCSEQNVPLTVSKASFKKDEAQIQQKSFQEVASEKSQRRKYLKSEWIFSIHKNKTNKQTNKAKTCRLCLSIFSLGILPRALVHVHTPVCLTLCSRRLEHAFPPTLTVPPALWHIFGSRQQGMSTAQGMSAPRNTDYQRVAHQWDLQTHHQVQVTKCFSRETGSSPTHPPGKNAPCLIGNCKEQSRAKKLHLPCFPICESSHHII